MRATKRALVTKQLIVQLNLKSLEGKEPRGRLSSKCCGILVNFQNNSSLKDSS